MNEYRNMSDEWFFDHIIEYMPNEPPVERWRVQLGVARRQLALWQEIQRRKPKDSWAPSKISCWQMHVEDLTARIARWEREQKESHGEQS